MIWHKRMSLAAVWAYLLFFAVFDGHAASVRQVSMDEMLEQCELVFEGSVLTMETVENRQNRIHTRITFEIHDVIKGEYPYDTVTLRFLGGTAGGVTMAVGHMKYPRMGEHGIYFVASVKKPQAHPFYGWAQGHFLVVPDDTGTQRVMTSSNEPVTAVIQQDPLEREDDGQTPSPELSKGVAKGVVLAQKSRKNKGLTTDEFKKILRDKMKRSQ